MAIFDRDCWWRDVALSGLEAAGRHYRIAFTSESTVGVRAAVSAGIAAGLLSAGDDTAELVPLPDMDFQHGAFLVLRRRQGATGNICDAMCEAIRGSLLSRLNLRSPADIVTGLREQHTGSNGSQS